MARGKFTFSLKKWRQRLLTYLAQDPQPISENRQKAAANFRIFITLTFFVFMLNFAIIVGTDNKFGVDLSEAAKQVHTVQRIIPARRGNIYDRNGVPIAETSTTYSIYAVLDKDYTTTEVVKLPKPNKDGKTTKSVTRPLYVQEHQQEELASLFQEFLGLERSYVLEQFNQKGLVQVSFGTKGNNLSYSTMKRMTERLTKGDEDWQNDLSGIYFTGYDNRMYPNGSFASQFIGLAQQKENEDGSKSLVGTTGLEASLDDILSGQDGVFLYEKDRVGLPLLGTEERLQEVKDGQDVYTTLSAPLQRHLEDLMDEFQDKSQGVFSSATLIQAKTGQILATSQRPSFNSDTKEGLDDEQFSWNNLLYQTNYEPGSTMKVMTTAAAIDAGVFDPNEGYYNDQIMIADATIRDWDVNSGLSEGRYMTMANALPFSSNIGMTMLEQKMGDERWLNYLAKFRFGFPTRFGMGGEATGLLPADNIVTHAMSSFGQGISVTQVQMLRAFSAIANDGIMLEPQFISRIEDPNTGMSRVALPEVMGKPVSKEATDQTLEYMVHTGTDPYFGTMYAGGLGGPIIQAGNQAIAMKSGTAQIAGQDGSGYLTGPNDYIHSVVAMVPAEDPEFIMYATVQQPRDGWTGMYWQGLFNPLLEEALLMGDSLDGSHSNALPTAYALPKLTGASPGDTADELRRNLLHPIILGTGNKVTKVSAKEGSDLPPGSQILLLTNKLETLPDMYGWTEKNVRAFSKWTGVEIEMIGSGQVIRQDKPVGTEVKNLKKLSLTLSQEVGD